ncbi:MAG: RcnB family protein [Pseudomonadota bacterium]
MRFWMMAAISAAALGVAVPAAAQVYDAPIPAPGGAAYGQQAPQYGGQQYGGPPPFVQQQHAPQVQTAGPRVWQDGRWMALPPSQNIARQNDPNRWGYEIEGQWYGGAQAPGGWGAYRRLGRGHHMPQYWLGGSFGIPDYLSYGLASPPRGYRWVRYYNDAVLIDDRGGVWDSVGGIAWAGARSSSGGSHSNSSSYSYSSSGMQQVDPNQYYAQQQQYPGGYAPPAAYAPPTVQYGYGNGNSASYGASYQQQGYYQGGPSTTSYSTITIIPTITTTTIVEEEIIEESVVTTSYVRAAPRRVVRRAAPVRHRAKPRKVCCRCVCR